MLDWSYYGRRCRPWGLGFQGPRTDSGSTKSDVGKVPLQSISWPVLDDSLYNWEVSSDISVIPSLSAFKQRTRWQACLIEDDQGFEDR